MKRLAADDALGRAAPVGEEEGAAIDLGVLPELVGYNLRCAQVAVFQDFKRGIGEADLSPPQFGALVLIEANPGISQSAIAAALRFDRSTLVQIIDRLEQRGLVKRNVSPRDRRSHALRLTAEGARTLATLKRLVAEHEARIASGLSVEERQSLIALLARIHGGR